MTLHRSPAPWILALLLAACGAAVAQTAWPERPITMIVPFPPGGVADTVARPVAEALGRELKQSVVVENKAGAGGAARHRPGVARRRPTATRCCSACRRSRSCPRPTLILNRKPAYTLDQFKPIARFTADPTVLVVRADAPWKTLQEFVADMKKQARHATTTAARATTGRCMCRWRCSRPRPGFA